MLVSAMMVTMSNRVWGYALLVAALILVWADHGVGYPITWIAVGAASLTAVYLLAADYDDRR